MELSTKPELWEIHSPEPLVFDSDINDEHIISHMAGIQREDELKNIARELLQQPTSIFVVKCSEKDIYEYFNATGKEYGYKTLENEDDVIGIVVHDLKDKVIGKGVIIRLGKVNTLRMLKKNIDEHMSNFSERYSKGNKRFENLMLKINMINKKMSFSDGTLS